MSARSPRLHGGTPVAPLGWPSIRNWTWSMPGNCVSVYTTWPTCGRVLADSNLRPKSTMATWPCWVTESITTALATALDRPAATSTASVPAMSVRRAVPRGSVAGIGRRCPGLTWPPFRKKGVKPSGDAVSVVVDAGAVGVARGAEPVVEAVARGWAVDEQAAARASTDTSTTAAPCRRGAVQWVTEGTSQSRRSSAVTPGSRSTAVTPGSRSTAVTPSRRSGRDVVVGCEQGGPVVLLAYQDAEAAAVGQQLPGPPAGPGPGEQLGG